jgi:hypothetical protein
MPTSTFTPGDQKQDEDLNRSQQAADQLLGSEQHGTINMDDFERNFQENADSSEEDKNIEKARLAENTPSETWRNETTPNTKGEKGEKKKGWFRRAGPLLGIGGGLGVGGFALIALTSPSLLIVQMKETMTNKFNTQLSAMELRSNKLLVSKLNGATTGYCSSKISIRCKFTTMSEKQVKRMADAGIEVKGEKTITGRTRPSSLLFEGKEISAPNFLKETNSNPRLKSAFKQVYNAKYAGFVGKAWDAVAKRFKISKQAPELDAAKDKEKAKAKINEIAKEGVEDTGSKKTITASDKDCETNCTSQDTADKVNNGTQELDTDGKSGAAAAEVRSKLSGINSGAVTSVFKLTGVVDSYCQVYGGLTTLSYASKVIKAAQLARYFMIFATIADAIKAGDSPDPADVSLLGTALTTTVKDPADSSKTLVGSATDSYGYKYAAYGDAGGSEQSMSVANRFIAGGGFVGTLSAVGAAASSVLGGTQGAKTTCGTLANPVVQGASVVLGLLSLLVPGANVAKIATQAAISASIGIVISLLPSMLADIVAGTVTEDIVGEEAGNAMTSGAGGIMSDALAAQNGAAPMTKSDAIAYNNLQTETTNQYIADEAQKAGPFDASNQYTFLGSISSALLTARSSSNILSSLGSIFSSSLRGIVSSNTSAVSSEEYAKSLEVCSDPNVKDTGFAVDPFCNVIRGIPERYLNKDPLQVVDELGSGNISEDGTPVGPYKEFIDKCITTQEPLGFEDPTTGYDIDGARSCIINDSNANYYLNYMDQRIALGQDGDDVVGGSSTVSLVGKPEGAVDAKNGWTLAPGVDYSKYTCDSRTTEANASFKITANSDNSPATGATLRLCAIPYYTGDGANGSNLVASVISENAMNMFDAARAEGIQLQLNDGMRLSFSSGYVSQHTTGIAMDIGVTGENTICRAGADSVTGWGSPENAEVACKNIGGAQYAAYKWLQANAGKYGFHNLEVEPWHWSASGL